jgi:Family of unknown function (DUF6088)
MCTSTFIKRHILELPKGMIFSTREMLNYGRRSAVDQCLYRLVKTGRIIRLARGLFMTEYSDNMPPSALQVAKEKAKAFGKQILTDAVGAAQSIGLNVVGNTSITYAINGHSSSFKYEGISIHFRGICARKMSLRDDTVGLAIKALWQLGRQYCNQAVVARATNEFKRSERHQFRQSCHIMPEWMTNIFMR